MVEPNLCCTLNKPQEVARRGSLIRALYDSAVESRELENGFALRFRGDSSSERKVFDFIAKERDCCRFLSFNVRLAAERGAIWLEMEGPTGVKEFARAELGKLGLEGKAQSVPKNK